MTAFFSELRRFKNPAGVIILLILSIGIAFMIKASGVKGGVLLLIALIGPVVGIAIIAFPKFGIFVLLIFAVLINYTLRMDLTTFPLGTIMDGIQALLILGFFIKQKYTPDWEFMKNPISIMIIIWIAYNFLEIINPSAESRMAWIYTIRGLAIVTLTYFIFSYHIRDINFIRLIIKLMLAISLLGALYAYKQQFIGFTGFEEAYLYSDPIIRELLFIGGEWRKFSFFSDPVTFSYNMVFSSILCIGLMYGPISTTKKIILVVLIFFYISSMLFSGTRSAYVLLPAALGLLAILKLSRKTLMYTVIGGFFMIILIFLPTSNMTLYRFQSAFKPSDDISYNVRANNQKFIQPYIQSHPMGGGLGSTGVWGAKFSPNSFLAAFPPDSGYVRVAVEMGWIGLLIFCILMFTILKIGIENYYKIRDRELQCYCLGMLLIVFAFNIGNYPQEALVQYPANIFFFLVTALINITYKLDKEKIANTLPDSQVKLKTTLIS